MYSSINSKVCAACLNQTPLDWIGNQNRILSAIKSARNAGAKLLVLPEMCITGYGCEDAFLRRDVAETSLQILHEITKHTSDIAVTLGLPMWVCADLGNSNKNNSNKKEQLYNCVAFVCNKTIHGIVAKQTLAKTGVHYEPRWFEPWDRGHTIEVSLTDANKDKTTICPFGDVIFKCGEVCIGFEICEDAWSDNRPAPYLILNGVNLILNPSASHFAFGKIHKRAQIVKDAVASGMCAYVLTNLVGNEAGRIIYDGGSIFAWDGQVCTIGKRFSFNDVVTTFETMHISATNMPNSSVEASTIHPKCITTQFNLSLNLSQKNPSQSKLTQTHKHDAWESGQYLKEEEFARAVSLGLFDYMRKCKAKGFVVSLSGGVDSSSVACLCAIMTHLAIKELGNEGFWQKLSHLKQQDNKQTNLQSINKLLLTCAYQSTKNSSNTTRNAAKSVADALSASYYEFNVDPLVETYTNIVSNAIGRNLTWKTDDISLQNIQARVRAPSVWLLANVKEALLLATSNRSEAAVGYTTMDGDTCGGISPIAGVDKTFLRHWLYWMQTIGVSGMGAIEALHTVTQQAPTAELRPLGCHQTDETDLMPYEVLDSIESLAIKDWLGPIDVYKSICNQFNNVSPDQCAIWVKRFFKLWCINQWKRERYAPSFHLDDESLDPKTWCRFPILSSGFEKELQDIP